jgi:hypothetical protein
MKELIDALKYFEDRNNISAFVTVHSDGVLELFEFWEEDNLASFKTSEEMHHYLLTTQYALDEEGICIKPKIL